VTLELISDGTAETGSADPVDFLIEYRVNRGFLVAPGPSDLSIKPAVQPSKPGSSDAPINLSLWKYFRPGRGIRAANAHQDQFTSASFDRIFCEYKLFSYVDQPGLLLAQLNPAHA
jgi:hypothetical protein